MKIKRIVVVSAKFVGAIALLLVIVVGYIVAFGCPNTGSINEQTVARAEGVHVEVSPSVQLFYREAGSGPPILLIHGTGGDADSWFDSFHRLAKSHRVIAYDRRRYTGSSGPTPTSDYFHAHAEDAAALMGHLKVAKATVVGWSAGGLVAIDLALHHPELVAALVLMEPPFQIQQHVTPSMGASFAKIALLKATRAPNCAAEAFYRFATKRRDEVDTLDQLPAATRMAMLKNSAASLVELDHQEQYTAEQVGTIKIPVLLITGAASRKEFLVVMDKLKRLLPHATTLEIPNAGHFMQFEAPGRFEQGVASIADKVS